MKEYRQYYFSGYHPELVLWLRLNRKEGFGKLSESAGAVSVCGASISFC